jgi:hypothetical protein
MHPSTIVAGSGKAFVKDIQVEKPAVMQLLSIKLDMVGSTISGLNNRNTIPKVPGIVPCPYVGSLTGRLNVSVASAGLTYCTSSILIIAAPVIALPINRIARGLNMQPSIFGDDRRDSFIETKGPLEPRAVSSASIRVNVPGLGTKPNRSKAGRVELQDLVEALFVGRVSIGVNVVRSVGYRGKVLPLAHRETSSTGLRILHPRHSFRFR